MPPKSDVILHIPDGVCGVLLGNIHTDLSKFAHLVRDTECIVSPVCDLHVEFTKGNMQERQPFKLLIPHIMKDFQLAKEQSRIQIFEHSNKDPLTVLPLGETEEDTSALPLKQVKPLFCVSRNYVELFCNHFCQILVSAEAAGCCCQSANLLVFSRMDPPNEYTSLPLANMKIYLTSLLTNMDDFFQVFISSFKKTIGAHYEVLFCVLVTHSTCLNFQPNFWNFQIIRDYEAQLNKRNPVACLQLPLSSESYIASDSTLQLTARATDELQNTVWKAADGGVLSTEVYIYTLEQWFPKAAQFPFCFDNVTISDDVPASTAKV